MAQQQGRPPTEEETFYLDWGRESLKNNIRLSNDILKQQITISSALLGVSLIFQEILTTNSIKIAVVLSFFLSLIIAFIGLLPYERKVLLEVPAEIKSHKLKALRHKRYYLWTSALCLVVGFACIIAELILGMFTST
ncbi:MAG: hypothetical protein LUF85_10100 [Bacteroides sp.]|nr:hypothetical protein [Bacteroides sp.]